ncbi:MAG: hypoxanthine phosphoribosyltransferase [Clostridiales bacterium]|nr:hypoxanthine phosphoribosyltransferase [Clostridiales bacterium]
MAPSMNDDIEKILFSEEQLKAVIKSLGEQITRDYEEKNLLLVSILKGSVIIMADLMREIKIPAEIDFMAVSSYGGDTKTSGTVKIIKDLDRDIAGYDLLIVEDILDSGKTLSYLKDILTARNPKSIKICTLFDKPERREVPNIKADYVGAVVPDEFIVGYGLDYDQKYRNLPFVGILKERVYSK